MTTGDFGSYTVKSGDCLWNIAKNEYKLTDNTKIANTVNDIVAANKEQIKDPNLIYAGQKFSMPIYGNGETPKGTPGNNDPTAPATVADDATAAQKSLFSSYEKWASKSNIEKAQTGEKIDGFDVLKGKEVTAENLKTAFLDLAKGALSADDTSKDGKLDVNEYVAAAAKDYKAQFGKDGDEEAFKSYFNTINQNGDKYVDQNELASFFAALDSLDSAKEVQDGKIQLGSAISAFGKSKTAGLISDYFKENFA